MKAHHVHLTRQRTIMGMVLLLLTVAGGSTWWAWQATNPTTTAQQRGSTQIEPTKVDRTPAASQLQPPLRSQETARPAFKEIPTSQSRLQESLQPQSYWLQMNGQQISLVPQRITGNANNSSAQALTAGVVNLLANAPGSNQSSAIPSRTRLLSLQTTSEGIYVNLSREFQQGGGSDSMIYRVAQVLYTVTSLDPNAKVYLSIEGQLLDENHPLGGEGLVLRQPLTRQQFNQDFPLN
jgi:spore germination protein GerM